KVLRALPRFFPGNLKIERGFEESTEEILLGEHRAQNSKDDPKQQRALVGTRQTVTGHQCLPERSRADSSLYRYAWPGCKFRRWRVVRQFPIMRAGSMGRRNTRKYLLTLYHSPGFRLHSESEQDMKSLTIGRLAKQAGVNLETVRFYERRGLLPRPPRSA